MGGIIDTTSIISDNAHFKSFMRMFASETMFTDILKLALYPSDFGKLSTSSTTITAHMRNFLKEIKNKAVKINLENFNTIKEQTSFVDTILNIREANSVIITYDNVDSYISGLSIAQNNILNNAKQDRITDDDTFRITLSNILSIIDCYTEFLTMSQTLNDEDLFLQKLKNNKVSPLEAIKEFKDLRIKQYNILTNLKSINKQEQFTNYFVLGSPKSNDKVSSALTKFISSGFNSFNTGYGFFDKNLEGIETSSVYMITAASNHGKSLLLVNLCKSIIESNLHSWQNNDVVLVFTLEDDIFKVSRRFTSIFGNYKYNTIKTMYKSFSDSLKSAELSGIDTTGLTNTFKNVINDLLKNSISVVCDNKDRIILEHCDENTFTATDLANRIENFRIMGYNVKLVILDYVDCMTTSISSNLGARPANMYEKQGQIVQELRAISRQKKVSIITASQNKRDSESNTTVLDNSQIGDSYLKIRYSDFVIMGRMHRDLDIFNNPEIKDFLLPDFDNLEDQKLKNMVITYKEYLKQIINPYEIKITKAKESNRDVTYYMAFCSENLKIYNNIYEFINEMDEMKRRSKLLQNSIEQSTNLTWTGGTSLTFDQDTPSPFDNENSEKNIFDIPDNEMSVEEIFGDSNVTVDLPEEL